MLSKVAAWVAAATKRSFGVAQLGEILAIAPEFYQLSRLTSNSIVNSNAALLASLAISTAAPLEPQLQSRRVEFRHLLAQLQEGVDVVPADIVALVRNPLVSSPQINSPRRRRRVGDDETACVDDRSPLRSAVVAQRRIDALLGHPSAGDVAVDKSDTTLVSHAELADQRGRELAELARRHLERQPLLSAADSGIDVLRSKFSQAKRATLPIDEVMSTLQVGLAITPAQAVTVLGYLLDAVPQWISKAQFGANAFVSIKPLSIMSTNAVHEAFLAHCSRKRGE